MKRLFASDLLLVVLFLGLLGGFSRTILEIFLWLERAGASEPAAAVLMLLGVAPAIMVVGSIIDRRTRG